jgi:hypothetical protein
MKKRPDARNKPEFKAKFIEVAVDQMKMGWTNEAIKKGIYDNSLFKKGDTRLQAIIDEARAECGVPDPNTASNAGVELTDFYAYMPTHQYIFTPTREMWPASSVNSRLLSVPVLKKDGTPATDANGNPRYTKPSSWLDVQRPVEQMTWAPGEPLVIPDRLISEGGWVEHIGISTFNLYRPPTIKPGDSAKATRWVDLIRLVDPDDAEHIMDYFAHRVQRSDEKINHGLVLGGDPGIGKDTLVEALKEAVGPWNCKEASPQDVMGSYNDFMRSIVLRISEARDLGDVNRFAFYEHSKTLLAAPPHTVRVNAKYIPHHYAFNVCGVIFTTNNKTDCLYLPADDRRHYVAWSDLKKEHFDPEFWLDFYAWYQTGDGFEHVAAFLAGRDLSRFDAKAPPKKTAAFWAIVDAGVPAEQSELADVIDEIAAGNDLTKKPPKNVDALSLSIINDYAIGQFFEWLQDRKNRRSMPRRFEKCGYTPVRNPDAEDGLWVIKRKRQVIYARSKLSAREQFTAAQTLIKTMEA